MCCSAVVSTSFDTDDDRITTYVEQHDRYSGRMDPLVYEEIILTPTSTIGKEQTIICYHNHSFVWEERVVVFVIYFHQVFKILRIMTLVIPSSVYILKRIHHRTCLYVNLIVKKKHQMRI